YVSFYYYADLCVLRSFPTRRSSDLRVALECDTPVATDLRNKQPRAQEADGAKYKVYEPLAVILILVLMLIRWQIAEIKTSAQQRSEEHTSELQSRFDLVCRLLLE